MFETDKLPVLRKSALHVPEQDSKIFSNWQPTCVITTKAISRVYVL